MIRAVIVLVLLLFLKNVAHGQQNLNQECILGNAEPGRCIRSNECSDIAELLAKNVIKPQDIVKLDTAARACGSDLNSADAIVSGQRPTTSVPTPPTRIPTSKPKPRITPLPVTTSTIPPNNIFPASCGLMPAISLLYPVEPDEDNIHVWAVYLEIQRSNYTGRCAGTLIHERFVLTAAHCVHTSRRKDIKLYFGLDSYSEREECAAFGEIICQKRRAAELIVHPNYSSHSQLNDVALIRLVRAVNITDHVRPACLPMNHLFDEDRESDTRVISVDWGEIEEGERSDTKRVVQLEVIRKDECTEQLRQWHRFDMSMIDRVMCTRGLQERHDVCEGDGGAPLLQYRKKRFHVVGVASFGPKCGIDSDKASVATRVSEYITWILTNLE